MTTERLGVQLELDSRAFNRSLNRVRTNLRRFTTATNRTLATTARGLRTASIAAGALAVSIGAAGAGLASFGANFARDMRRAQALTGATAAQIDNLATTLRLAGAEQPIEAATEVLREFGNRLGESLQEGTGAAFDAFQKLNLDVAELNAQFERDQVGAINTIIARVVALDDASRQTFNFEELFGGAGSEFAQLIANLSDYERALLAAQASSNVLVSQEQLDALNMQNAEFTALRKNLSDVATQFSSALAPSITEALRTANTFIRDLDIDPLVTNFRRGAETTFRIIGDAARVTLPRFGTAFTFVQNRLETFGDFFRNNRSSILSFFSSILAAAENFRNRFNITLDFQAIEQGEGNVAGFFERTFNRVREVVQNIIDSDLFQQFLASTEGIRSLIAREFTATLEVITQRLLPALEIFARGFITFIGQLFGTADEVSPLLRTFGLLIEVVIAFTGAFVRGILETLALLFEFSGRLSDAIRFVGNLPILNQIIEGFNNILIFLRDLPDVIQSLIVDIILAFAFPPSLAATGGRILGTFGRFITQWGRRIAGFLPSTVLFVARRIPVAIDDIARILRDRFNRLPMVFQNILRSLGSSIVNAFNNIRTSILSGLARIFGAFSGPAVWLNALRTLNQTVVRFLQGLIQSVQRLATSLPNAFGPILRAIQTFLVNIQSAFTAGLGVGIRSLISFLDNTLGTILRWFDTFSSTFGNAIQEVRSDFEELRQLLDDIRDLFPDIELPELVFGRGRGITVPQPRDQLTGGSPITAMAGVSAGGGIVVNGPLVEVQGDLAEGAERRVAETLTNLERRSGFVSNLATVRVPQGRSAT